MGQRWRTVKGRGWVKDRNEKEGEDKTNEEMDGERKRNRRKTIKREGEG